MPVRSLTSSVLKWPDLHIVQAALQKWPDEKYLIPQLAETMIKAGKEEDGLKMLKSAIEKWPDDKYLLSQAMNSYVRLKKKDEALVAAGKLVQLSTTDADKVRALFMAAQRAQRKNAKGGTERQG